MRTTLTDSLLFVFLLILFFSCSKSPDNGFNELTKEEYEIIINKGTEPKFSGQYNEHKEVGTYICKQCDQPLFKSVDKFDSKTGWPSFDDFIPGNVNRKNADAVYTELTCSKCQGHLGHAKKGEKFTPKNIRYCINSLALKFIKD